MFRVSSIVARLREVHDEELRSGGSLLLVLASSEWLAVRGGDTAQGSQPKCRQLESGMIIPTFRARELKQRGIT